MLPDQTGLRLLARIRADRQFNEIPVIMLTAKSMEEDKLAGLNTAPTTTSPSRSRRANCWRAPRRCCGARARSTTAGDDDACGQCDAGSGKLQRQRWTNEKIDIGHAEYKLLKFLLAHPERVFSRSQLLDKVWGDHVVIEERTVDVHVLRLRKALKEAEHLIKTVRSVGYMLSEK
jgi:two-component system phosphate regulon response regulator PhoB